MTLPNQEELRVIVTLMLALLPLALGGLGTWLAIKVVESKTGDTHDLQAGAALCWTGAAVLGGIMFMSIVIKAP